MADTSSNVQFKVENGLLVLGTANIAGPAVFNGNVDLNGTYLSIAANLQSNIVPVNNTYSIGNSTSRWILNAMTGNFAGAVTVTSTVASGNTTVTGFINVSSTANVGGATNLRGVLEVNGAVTIANTLAVGNTTVTGFINVSSTANVGGATTLRDTLTVNGTVTIPNTLAVGNSTITGFANVVGTSATFNALTGVANTTDFITTSTAHGFSDGDLVRYVVAAGNTAVGGLANATNYYVVSSNSTAFQLSVSRGGLAIDLTAGVTQTGHTLIPQRISLSAAGNIESPIGLANVGSLRVLGAASITGAATVNGALTVSNTAAVGNTTITGFANVSSTLAAGDTTVTGFINVSSTANVGGATTLRGTLTVNGATTVANTLDVGNTTITGFANIVGTSATFNALTGVANTTDFITTSTAHGFSDGDLVRYIVAAGNTAVGGLANATNYYVVSSNSTAFKLSATYAGSAIDLTAGTTQTGHTLIPQRIRFSTAGNIDTSLGQANVASLRVLSTAVVNGAVTFANTLGVTGATTLSSTLAAGNTTITGFANISTTLTVTGNATFDTDLLFLDAVNNRVGFKNTSPSSDLISINGNTVITSANAAVRFLSGNATHNAHVSLAGNTTYSRLTVTTYEANATANDGGFLFQSVNSTATTAVLQFNQTEFKYEAGNVVHAGNFGIYDVSGTRLGP